MFCIKYKVRRNDTCPRDDLGSSQPPRGVASTTRFSAFRAQTVPDVYRERIFQEETNEHLDSLVRRFANRLAGRVHGIPRGGWVDSPAVGFRSDFANFAFCAGQARRVKQTDTLVFTYRV